jgi:hypothetical protein
MTPVAPWNLFALVSDAERPVLRVPLSQEMQQSIRSLFDSQAASLVGDRIERVPFEPAYSPDDSEVFFVGGFSLPEAVQNALANPLSLENVAETESALAQVKGFFTGDSTGQRVLFQVFDRRRLLRPSGFTLVLIDRTFRRLESAGVTLDNKLVAIYEDERLYFRSLQEARRLFDLSSQYAEATDAELGAFANHRALAVEDRELFLSDADAWTRKHVALIMRSGVMDTKTPQEIVGVARSYGVAVSFDGDGRLVVPRERKSLKELLKLLNESFFTSDLSGRQYVANSKRPLR